jgi:hypothetical protein
MGRLLLFSFVIDIRSLTVDRKTFLNIVFSAIALLGIFLIYWGTVKLDKMRCVEGTIITKDIALGCSGKGNSNLLVNLLFIYYLKNLFKNNMVHGKCSFNQNGEQYLISSQKEFIF